MLFRVFNTLFISILFLTFSFTQNDRDLFVISGYVLLEDSLDAGGTHEGVTISVKSLLDNPPSLVESSESGEDGFYSITIDPGYYLVEWTKDGYVPWEQGDIALATDLEMEDVILIPGSVHEVAGDVSGNWTTSYQYWVTENITVPEGDSLIIDAGVRVKFFEGTGLVANGKLEINGTDENHVLFTSKLPTPLPGDWDNIELYGENNVISYLYYEYADDGFTGDNASGSSFDHLHMVGTLSLTANGIYLTNSSNMSFTNNHISVAGNEILYCSEAANSSFSGNVLTGTGRGVYANNAAGSTITNNEVNTSGSDGFEMDYCHNCLFDGNTVTNRPYTGIEAKYSDSLTVTNNNLDVYQYGMDMRGGSTHHIDNNTITDFDEHGIYFDCSENSIVSNNILESSTYGTHKWGTVNTGCSNNTYGNKIFNNYISIYTEGYVGCCWEEYNQGIQVYDAEIYNNTIINQGNTSGCSCGGRSHTSAIRADRSIIYDNVVEAYQGSFEGENGVIICYANSDIRCEIFDNNITATSNMPGIRSSYSNVYNNTITSESNSHWGIISGDYDSLMYNTVTGMRYGISVDGNWDNYIDGNTLDVDNWGIYANDANGEHKYLNNTINMSSGDWLVHATNMDNIIIEDNIFVGDGGNGFYINNTAADINRNLLVTPGRGIQTENQAGSEINQNTIIGSNGDYGIHISNLSAPTVYSNIIQGFQVGIHADNDLSNNELRNNDLWMITNSNFQGTAMPPLIGNYVSENNNGDATDIYGNMSMDPLFSDELNGDYSLVSISPCINAGNPAVTDPDGTVGDMGAFYHHIYLVLDHALYGNTIDTENPYTINASAYATAGDAVEVDLYYSTDGDDFDAISMTNTEDNNFTANIPNQSMDTHVQYYLEVTDGTNTLTDPYGAPENSHSFDVTLVLIPAVVSTNAEIDGSISMSWTPPILNVGELISIGLYRSTEPGLDFSDFYAALTLEDFSFEDTDTYEGTTYYYRLGGAVDVGDGAVNLFVSDEVAVMSDHASIVFADGNVTLDGTDDYGDILVEFERTSPTPVEYDTVYTDASGYYQHLPGVGIYNVNFYKYGWQPGQIGGLYLTENQTIETMDMEQGYTVFVDGSVSGNWTSENVYFATADISVDEGDTLTIDAGVKVLFTDYYSLNVNGTLIADGSEDDRISFTSAQPIPAPGDWSGLNLYGPGHVLRFVDYEYADGQINGTDVDYLTFEYNTISSLPLSANGLILNNDCDHLKINNNTIEILGENSIQAFYSDSSEFNYNTFDGSPYRALYTNNGSYTDYIGNTFNDFEEYGIYCPSSHHINVLENEFIFSSNGDWKYGVFMEQNMSGYGHKNNLLSYNTFSVTDECSNTNCRPLAIKFYDSVIHNNNIEFNLRSDCYSYGLGIYGNRSHIYDNTVYISDLSTCNGEWSRNIEAYGETSNRNIIHNNHITTIHANKAIDANYADIYDNYMTTGEEIDHANCAIGNGDYNHIYNNTLIGGFDSGIYTNDRQDNIVENNYIEVQHHGIYGSNAKGHHVYNNNTIRRLNNFNVHAGDGHWLIYMGHYIDSATVIGNDVRGESGSGIHIHTNGSAVLTMHDNYVEADYYAGYFLNVDMDAHHNLFHIHDHTGEYNGIRIHGSSDGSFYNNTIVADNGSYGDGIELNDYSDVNVFSNIVTGFQRGLEANATVTNISSNDFWGNDVQFTGDGLPALLGDINTANSNGDPSDVYGNIFLDPNFALPGDDNFNLQIISPCINAGNGGYTDPDGTISDIGAFYRDESLLEDIFGCLNVDACNYNEYANQDDGNCTYADTWYADQDGDGLGSPNLSMESCDQPAGFVSNNSDPEPDCVTNDSDECGVCGGTNADQDCNGDCNGEATTDSCDVCSGGNSGHSANSDQDCNGECFGEAYLDGCSICVGGTTELEACPEDCTALPGGDAFWDDCGICSGGNSGHDANAEMDCMGVCNGSGIIDDFEGCCQPEDMDECNKCGGNGWDYCDDNENGITNYDEWRYGVHDITIEDIPNDQGSWVLLGFSGSYHDSDTLRSTEIYTIERWDGAYWNSLHSLSAYGSDVYYTEARTAVDSTSTTDDGMTLFRIIANMDEGNFENVEEAWGYSVDNISPIVPTQMSASSTGNNVSLNWQYELEEDFAYHSITSLNYSDNTISNEYSFYLDEHDEHWVNAFDTHGNVSENSQSLMSIGLYSGANLISFNVLPEDNSIENVLASIEGNVIGVIGQGVAASYSDDNGWAGSVTTIDHSSGYWIMMSENDILLVIGEPTQRGIYNLGEGANIVSYPYRYPTSVEEAIPGDIGCDISGIIGAGVAALCTESGWEGSLLSLDGSYGYWFIAEEATDITFNGCDENCDELTRSIKPTKLEGYDFNQSTSQAFYFIEDIENIEMGDWILAYNGDNVIGARQWMGSIIDVPAMGDDGSDYTKGYIEKGGVPTFKILRGDELINLEGDVPAFENNQLYMVSSLTEAVALPESFSLDRAYPNPFNPTTTLSFALPVVSNVLLEVYDINGRIINELINYNMDAGYHSIVWNADAQASGVYFVKMVAGEFVNTQKLMLIK